MNKKKILLIVLAIIVAAAAIGLAVHNSNDDGSSDNGQKIEKQNDDNGSKDGSDKEKGEKADKGGGSGVDASAIEDGRVEKKSIHTEPDSDGTITLPYQVPGSTIVISKITSYDGIFIEDGSDEDADGITVAVVENIGKTPVEYSDITVFRGKKELHFVVTDLDAGALMMVQESKQRSYKADSTYRNCSAQTALIEEFELSEDKVKVGVTNKGSLKVTNLTDETIPCVRIFYKFYMEDKDAYVGGITYTAKVTDLKGGESQNVHPSHFLKGYSKIVMVRTYDTDEE